MALSERSEQRSVWNGCSSIGRCLDGNLLRKKMWWTTLFLMGALRCRTLWALDESAEFVAGAGLFVGLEVQISWQV